MGGQELLIFRLRDQVFRVTMCSDLLFWLFRWIGDLELSSITRIFFNSTFRVFNNFKVLQEVVYVDIFNWLQGFKYWFDNQFVSIKYFQFYRFKKSQFFREFKLQLMGFCLYIINCRVTPFQRMCFKNIIFNLLLGKYESRRFFMYINFMCQIGFLFKCSLSNNSLLGKIHFQNKEII